MPKPKIPQIWLMLKFPNISDEICITYRHLKNMARNI